MRRNAMSTALLGAWLAWLTVVPGFAEPRTAAETPSTTPPPPASVPAPRAFVLRKLFAADEAGYARKVFYTVEPAIYFHALIRYAARRPAPPTERTFILSVSDHGGHEVARLGGPLPAGLDPAQADLPRDCNDEAANGVRLADTDLARHPGRYHAQAWLDGAPAGDLYFEIKRLQGEGEIRVTSAVVEDAQANRRFTFTSKDRGVYAHVTMINATRTTPHAHLVQVGFFGPDGQQVGRRLGGVVHLDKGTHLDGRDFPTVCDAEHHDGMRIEGTPIAKQTGGWVMRLYVDGRVVAEVPFRIVP